ncbi:MAG: TlpA family protein disulfide reductase [Lachnospiraceae bacterium]|nr:TlpA family protein disulfide reductase [Lachnospiraceae bacterium]
MFQKFVKITCATVVSCLLLGSFAACGKGEENTGEPRESQVSSVEESNNLFPDRANANEGKGKVKELKEGDVAPDFTAQLTNGAAFTLSDYDDKVVILNFFATWCGPCVREMPAFEMLKDDGYSELAILCVNCMEDAKTVDGFVKENGYSFPIAYDEDGIIEKYYPTDGIPYTLVIKKGVIANIYLGAMDAQTQYKEYKGAIDACLQ